MRSTTKTERQIKADQVLDMILKYIRDNDLKPGDRIPSERALSELFARGTAGHPRSGPGAEHDERHRDPSAGRDVRHAA